MARSSGAAASTCVTAATRASRGHDGPGVPPVGGPAALGGRPGHPLAGGVGVNEPPAGRGPPLLLPDTPPRATPPRPDPAQLPLYVPPRGAAGRQHPAV